MLIKCCRYCVPPKRYPGCAANCEEYKKEKAEHELVKQKQKENIESCPIITSFDFDKTRS